jgi:hypothetical protein
MRMWFERAAKPEDVEYIFACNRDDPTLPALKDALDKQPHGGRAITNNFHGSAPAWDAAANASTGSVLIQAQDDVEPPRGWDAALLKEYINGTVGAASPAFIAVSDGYRKDRLCCTAIMNRARYEQCGHFLCPEYLSVFSDDEVTYRAYRDQLAGLCTVIEARDLIFLHRHAYHDASVPMDATYAKENSAEAYRIGAALFAKRNPQAAVDGVRDWK